MISVFRALSSSSGVPAELSFGFKAKKILYPPRGESAETESYQES